MELDAPSRLVAQLCELLEQHTKILLSLETASKSDAKTIGYRTMGCGMEKLGVDAIGNHADGNRIRQSGHFAEPIGIGDDGHAAAQDVAAQWLQQSMRHCESRFGAWHIAAA